MPNKQDADHRLRRRAGGPLPAGVPKGAVFALFAMTSTLWMPPPARADTPSYACTFNAVCAREDGCQEMPGFTQQMVPIEGEPGGWVWITEAGGTSGQTISAAEDETLTVLFPPVETGAGTLLVTIAPSHSATMTQHGILRETGEAVATSYFGACTPE